MGEPKLTCKCRFRGGGGLIGLMVVTHRTLEFPSLASELPATDQLPEACD